jgi:hypothetical protein
MDIPGQQEAALSQPHAILCPYCGDTQSSTEERCTACGGFFDPLSRKISQQHMGPWFIRDSSMPFRPGCSYQILLKQIQRGKITVDTILRGPTTRQYWAVARHVPGIAHHLGYCHACEAKVLPSDPRCPQCAAAFFEPTQRDSLGIDALDPNVEKEVARAQAVLAQQMRQAQMRAEQAARTASGGMTRESLANPDQNPVPVAKARIVATTSLTGAPGVPGTPGTPGTPASPTPQPTSADTLAWLGGDSRSDRFNPAQPQTPAQPPAPAPAPAHSPVPQLAPLAASSPAQLAAQAAALPPIAGPATAPLAPAKSGISPLVWAMISVNVVLALGFAALFLLKDDPQPAATPRSAPSALPSDNPAAPPSPAPVPVPNFNTPPSAPPVPAPVEARVTPTIPITPRPVAPTQSVANPNQLTPPTTGSSSLPATGVSSGNPVETPKNATFFGISTSNSSNPLADAQADYNAGRLKESLAKLKQLRANPPAGVKTSELDTTIKSIEDELKRKELDAFFGN